MPKHDQITLYVVMVILIAMLIWSIFSLTQKNYFSAAYNKAIQSQNKENICATPEGYTDAEWREHMGHHPDQYRECLS